MNLCPVCSSTHLGASLSLDWIRCFDCGHDISKPQAQVFSDITELIVKLYDEQILREVYKQAKDGLAISRFKQNSSYFMKKEGKYPW